METNPSSLQNLKYQPIKPEGDTGIGFQHRVRLAFLTVLELLHDYQDENTERKKVKGSIVHPHWNRDTGGKSVCYIKERMLRYCVVKRVVTGIREQGDCGEKRRRQKKASSRWESANIN